LHLMEQILEMRTIREVNPFVLGWQWQHRLRCECCRNPSLGFATKAKRSQGHGPRRVWKWRFTFPSELSFWELESRWIFEPLKSDCRGQNTSHWRILYIIEKLLKFGCLKWGHMTHLDIYNTSYGKKKAGNQTSSLTPDHKKLGIDPTFVRAHGVRYTLGNLLMRDTTLL
jgi:hypothetical protein